MARTGKRGFIPPQPAAALSALDFAAASQAFRRALALDASGQGSDLIAEYADRLIGVPASAPAQIAEKLTAYAWLHNLSPDLASPVSQRHIAERGDDAAKGLLALYLDLTTVHTDPLWEQAVARLEAASAQVEAYYDLDDDDAEEPAGLFKEHGAARAALLNLRAPDAKAIAYKAGLLIESQFTEFEGETLDNPDTLSRMLADYGAEPFVAAIYQDALALSGDTGPRVTAQPDPFDSEAWLEDLEARRGVRVQEGGIIAQRSGAHVMEANFEINSLPGPHRQKVSHYIYVKRQPPLEPPVPSTPTDPEEMQRVFARGLLNVVATDQRDAVAEALAGFGIVPKVWADKEGAEP